MTLNWTVTDSDASAADVAGLVDIRMAGSKPGTFIGMAAEGAYDLTGALTGDVQGNGSGTAQDASFSYTFTVPQYANATTARWEVSEVTAQDDQNHTLTLTGARLTGFHAVLTATELADSTAPTYDSLMFASPGQRPYVYDKGVNGSVTYYLEVLDAQSGFWTGSITLQGPRGQTATGTFSMAYSVADDVDLCNGELSPDDNDALCTVTVPIPAGAAAGTWTVSMIRLTDNAGNAAVYRNVDALPITVTANAVVTASGFSASPDQVNDWQNSTTSTVSFTVSGAAGGVSAAYVDASGACVQAGDATVAGDVVSVPMTVIVGTPVCTITGIAVLDGAGDLALYGSEYGAPSVNVTITQEPDTPPVIASSSLSPSSVTQSTSAQTVILNVTTGDTLAPVTDIIASLYDSSGNQVAGAGAFFSGYLSSGETWPLQFTVPANLAPGVYTVGMAVIDSANLSTSYGPSGQTIPGGPVQLTVTS
ncbi:MAG TPA: hypothetical protein VMC83_22760 [Streptosporangiaceae bacterium]|nr:hypothetical protein [Streptosporangiaceae bacterium]